MYEENEVRNEEDIQKGVDSVYEKVSFDPAYDYNSYRDRYDYARAGLGKLLIANMLFLAGVVLKIFPVIGIFASVASIAAYVFLFMGKYKVSQDIPMVKVSFVLDILTIVSVFVVSWIVVSLMVGDVYSNSAAVLTGAYDEQELIERTLRTLFISITVPLVIQLAAICTYLFPIGSVLKEKGKLAEANICKMVALVIVVVFAVYMVVLIANSGSAVTVVNGVAETSAIYTVSGTLTSILIYGLQLVAVIKANDAL